jgi:hypothetical protein
MHAIKLAAALAALCLLSKLASADSAVTEHHPTGHAHDPVSDATPATGASDTILIERVLGEGSSETIVVPQGSAVRLVLHAPAGTELHLHGYDLAGVSGPEAPVVWSFRAEHLGRFSIEAHGIEDVLGRKETALAYIEVRSE